MWLYSPVVPLILVPLLGDMSTSSTDDEAATGGSLAPIVFDDCLSSVDAHPHTNLLVGSTMTGQICL